MKRSLSVSPRALLVTLGLTLLAFITFLPVVWCQFTDFDDPDYVWKNPHVLGGLTMANLRWAWTTTHAGYWQPLSWVSLMLDSTLQGTAPGGYHLTNLLIHAFSAGVVFLVMSRMTGTFWRAALVAALYALHPLRVESIAWVAERKDVLSNLFAWLTIGGYLAYARSPNPTRYLLVLVLFVLGLLAKPMIVTLPCLLLLLDYWPLGRFGTQSLRSLIREKLPLMVLALAGGVAAAVEQVQYHATVSWQVYPFWPRLGNVLTSYGLYVCKMVWFANLSAFYPMPQGFSPSRIAASIGAGALLAAMTLWTIRERGRRPWMLVGWLWFVGVLAPVSGVFQSGPQLLADRFTYLPAVGLLVMIVWSIPKPSIPSLRYQWAAGGAAAFTVMALCVASWITASYWHDTGTLFARALDVTDDNWLAHDQVGLVYFRTGNLPAAMQECRRSLHIFPTDPIANMNYGVGLSKQGKDRQAIAYFRVALQVRPNYPDNHTNLGVSLQHCGDMMEAYQEYEKALSEDPDDEAAHSDLGGLLGLIGLPGKAVAELRAALALKPDDKDAQKKLAIALFMLKQPKTAAVDTGER